MKVVKVSFYRFFKLFIKSLKEKLVLDLGIKF